MDITAYVTADARTRTGARTSLIDTFLTLDRDTRAEGRRQIAENLADLYVVEATLRLRRIVPEAHQIRVAVHTGPSANEVDLLSVEDARGQKLRKPRASLVEQVERFLADALRLSDRWNGGEEHVVVLPHTCSADQHEPLTDADQEVPGEYESDEDGNILCSCGKPEAHCRVTGESFHPVPADQGACPAQRA